jgi:hypothetical protein
LALAPHADEIGGQRMTTSGVDIARGALALLADWRAADVADMLSCATALQPAQRERTATGKHRPPLAGVAGLVEYAGAPPRKAPQELSPWEV